MTEATEPIKVLITVPFDDDTLDAFRDVSERVDVMYHPAQAVGDVPDDVWAAANVLYTIHVVPEPALAPQLRWIHAHIAGVDHLIDQPIINAENVLLTTSSGIHAYIT